MVKSAPLPKLEDLWFEADSNALYCFSCKSKISPAALIRTFRAYHPGCGNEPPEYTKIIFTPYDENIVIYDRHLQCLLQSGIRYSAISHVWDPAISDTRRFKPQSLKARLLAVQQPLFIYRGLLNSGEISEPDEIWHDYISVPQWSYEIKNQILLSIPDIYRSAYLTIIYFEDLRKDSVQMLHQARSTHERVKSITDICDSKWFTRVWTAMEYVRSSRVIAMDEKFDVCSNREDPLFLRCMLNVWSDELSRHKSVFHLEGRATMGKNLVPWNLGPLLDMGKGKSCVFGHAFALLSRRRCQSGHDFVHALLGLVEPTSDRPLGSDFDYEYMRIAKLCLAVGDYSPLLLTPRLENEKYNKQWEIKQGLCDIGIWPLGAERQPPDFHQDFSFENGDFEEGYPVLKLAKARYYRQNLRASPQTRPYG